MINNDTAEKTCIILPILTTKFINLIFETFTEIY